MKRRRIIVGLIIVLLVGVVLTFIGEQIAEERYSDRDIPIGDKAVVRIGHIDLKPYIGGLDIESVTVRETADSAYVASIDRVSMKGLRLIDLVFRRKVEFRWLTIEGATVHIEPNRLKAERNESIDSAATIDFSLDRLTVDFDRNMVPNFRSVKINAFEYRPGKGKYDVDVARIESTEIGESLVFRNFSLIPRYGKYEFSRVVGRRTGRINIDFPQIKVKGLNVASLLDSTASLVARNITVSGGLIDVFTDKRMPLDPEHYVKIPNEDLMTAKLPISIDTVQARDLKVIYRSNNPKSLREGNVKFNSVYGSFYNITNLPEEIANDGSMYVDLRGNVLGQGELLVHFDFSLNTQDRRFDWEGELSKTELTEIDSFVMPVADMNLVSGYAHGLKFKFESNLERSVGTVDFEYSNLEVEALDINRVKKRKFLSRFVNVFILKSNNMKTSPHYKTGIVDYEHDTRRDIWHYLWTSIEKGITHIVLPDGLIDKIEQQSAPRKEGHYQE